MFNVKWGAVLGGAAFVLALLFSLLFGKVFFLTALLRALIFAVLFFLLGTGAWVLISSFIPELLFPDNREDTANIFSRETPGSRVDINLGDSPGAALPDTGGRMSGVDDVGDISDLMSGKVKPAAKDMDQMPPSGYTNNSDFAGNGEESGLQAEDADLDGFSFDFSTFTGGKAAGTESPGSFPAPSNRTAAGKAGGDAFGDTGGFSGSGNVFGADDIFSSAAAIGAYNSGIGSDGAPNSGESGGSERRVSSNKPQEFEGDFSPKEIASGIRTVLDKERKG
jgi:hypothetical protein